MGRAGNCLRRLRRLRTDVVLTIISGSDKAIDKEQYEIAARIRDKINDIDN